MSQYVFLVLILFSFGICYFALKNIFKIHQKKGKYVHLNKIHKVTEIVIISLILVFTFLFSFVFRYNVGVHYFIGALSVLFAFRGYMEWKYNKLEKQYIFSILTSITFIISFIGIELLS
ncbi:DUF4181 domain-containing protein [Robertmurraya sp. FSL R5-0851]|uniref:DUF4181 domain-containing protein n=1 Tax=Robertmurraya sp. FSL R5-0851 TaxID=2921584 RepID=UPI004046F996